MSTHFDAIVIGAGPGGLACATRLAACGKQTVLIEKDEIGGTCLNRGCVPTKTLMHTADAYRNLVGQTDPGLRTEGVSVDYEALKNKKETVVGTLRETSLRGLKAAKVTVLSGKATVTGIGQVVVKTTEGTEELDGDAIVVACGSEPMVLPIPGAELPTVWTSDDILENVVQLESLVIIGGGVIGMEFASLYNSLGTTVTVLEGMPRILHTMDREISQSLAMSLKKRGVVIETDAMVSGISEKDGKTSCIYTVKGVEKQVSADAVLMAVGRRTNLTEVFAPSVLPVCEKGRAVVNRHMQTNVEGIYVIGDAAAGYPQLAHAASAMGEAAACHIAGQPYDTDLRLVPGCVYTQPEIASVGMTEAEAKEAGLTYHTGKIPTTGNAKSVLSDDERGFVKVVSEENGVLLGAQMFCARATDMIGEFATAIANRLTETQMASVIRPHPTYEESIRDALEASMKKKK